MTEVETPDSWKAIAGPRSIKVRAKVSVWKCTTCEESALLAANTTKAQCPGGCTGHMRKLGDSVFYAGRFTPLRDH